MSKDLTKLTNTIYAYIFKEYFYNVSKYKVKKELKNILKKCYKLNKQKYEKHVLKIIFKKMSSLKEALNLDIKAYLENDPSINDEFDVILNPCFFAIYLYRLSNILINLNIPFLPKLLSSYAYSKTSIDINPKAKIGKYFFIDHGIGIVIGETAIIKDHVKIYQGVTLGAKSLNNASLLKGKKRHPTIMNNVTLYAECMILGGDTIINDNCIIGAKVLITHSIKENSIVKYNN